MWIDRLVDKQRDRHTEHTEDRPTHMRTDRVRTHRQTDVMKRHKDKRGRKTVERLTDRWADGQTEG